MKRIVLLIACVSVVLLAQQSAFADNEQDFSEGQWFRAALAIDATHEIPFFLWLPQDDAQNAIIRNGAEDIAVAFDRTHDEIVLDFPHYDSRIEARRIPSDFPHDSNLRGDDARFEGFWRKTRREEVSVVPFRCIPTSRPVCDFRLFAHVSIALIPGTPWLKNLHEPSTRWKIMFKESGPAIGLFTRTCGWSGWFEVDGTIETTTGDYRFLSGVKSEELGGWLKLSVFDGAHAFLFDGAFDETRQRMTGDFYSGAWFHETFTAERLEEGDDYQLPDPFSEVAVTSGDGRLHLAALDAPIYHNKPVLVQIFGTWCPNCHDETPALVDLYNRYHDDGLEVLALAYEVTGDDARSRRQVQRFKDRYHIPWRIDIAGTNDKAQASQTLPDISEVKSFPTVIWIGRDGAVRAIHSGFSGPATGETHTKLLAEFDRLTREIIRTH